MGSAFREEILLAKRFGILEPKAPGEGPRETERETEGERDGN
jgi:hypothetical protein